MVARRSGGRHGGRDTYPLRVLATGAGFILVMVVVLVWAAISGREDVSVPEPRAVERQETAAVASAPAPAPEGPATELTPTRALAGVTTMEPDTPRNDAALVPDTPRSDPASVPAATAPAPRSDVVASAPAATDTLPAATAAAPPAASAPPPARSTPPPPRSASPPSAGPSETAGNAALAEAFHQEGVYRLGRGEFDIAVQRLARAVEISPRNGVYRGNYGWALFNGGDAMSAATQLEESIRLAPERAITHANMAEVRLAQGDTAAALAAYARFIELNDDPALERNAERRVAEIRGR